VPATVSGNPARQPEIIMNEKSHVSMEQHVCLVCGVSFQTGNLLFDRRLRASMERHTLTGWGLCVEHRRMFDAGLVALVECDPQRSGAASAQRNLRPEQAYRTGQIVHLKREVFDRLFDVRLAADKPCVFVEPGLIEQLQAMVGPQVD